ncbi:class I SAM-dependent methyltransferase [Candidatus Omnitrophota bacterium]
MSLRKLKTAEYWNKEAQAFDSLYSEKKTRVAQAFDKFFRRGMYERFQRTLENSYPIEGRAFLDVGCGSGRYCLELARRGAKRIVGIDVSEEMLQMAYQACKSQDLLQKCEFIETDVSQFMPDESFNVSIAMGLFDYVKEPLPVLKNIKAVTTDYMLIAFPRRWSWRTLLRKIYLGIKKCDVYFYSKEKIAELMRGLGVKKYKIDKVAGLFFVKAFVPNI